MVRMLYQVFAEEQRAPLVMSGCPRDEVLHLVQRATRLYRPLQLILQTALKVIGETLHREKKGHKTDPLA